MPHTEHFTCIHSLCSFGGGLPRREITAVLCSGIFPIFPCLHLGHTMNLFISQIVTLSCNTIIIQTASHDNILAVQLIKRVKNTAIL